MSLFDKHIFLVRAMSGPDAENIQINAKLSEEATLYRGYRIITGEDSGRWWASVESLGVDTMLHSDQASALAEGMAFVDGFLMSEPGRH
jgi:hypothetical protein